MRRDVPPGREGTGREEPSEHDQRRKAAPGRAAGDYARMGMMILASAMRHSIGRPAMGMEGGTVISYEAVCQPPSESAFGAIS